MAFLFQTVFHNRCETGGADRFRGQAADRKVGAAAAHIGGKRFRTGGEKEDAPAVSVRRIENGFHFLPFKYSVLCQIGKIAARCAAGNPQQFALFQLPEPFFRGDPAEILRRDRFRKLDAGNREQTCRYGPEAQGFPCFSVPHICFSPVCCGSFSLKYT